jgi:hypothetical protein
MELSTTREATRFRPLNSFLAFHGTRRFNTEFTRALFLSLNALTRILAKKMLKANTGHEENII